MYEVNHLARNLRAASLGFEAATFLTDPASGQNVSHGSFWSNAERMAAALAGLGVLPGDRVAIQAPKTVEMLELYVGTLLSGAVFVPLNPTYTPTEIAYFLGDARPRVFVCAPTALAGLALVAQCAGVDGVLTLGADGTGTLRRARDAQNPDFTAVARARVDMAAILYTSGTTGRSKGAMLSHGALASNSIVLRDYWRFTRDGVLIHALPIFHTHGLFVAANTTERNA